MSQEINVMIEGGKATAAPPLGPALGPTGVNIGQVVGEINQKTASFAGMRVPVKVIIDSLTKKFEIKIGTPPTSALIKKEAGLEKGASLIGQEFVGELCIEEVIKITKMKSDSLSGKDFKSKVKEVIGSCSSMGILIEGKPPQEIIKLIDQGAFDTEISQERTEIPGEKLKIIKEKREKLKASYEKKRGEASLRAQQILKEMEGKDKTKIRAKMMDEKIPADIIEQLIPSEKKKAA